ncbi:hypothetical protein [Rhodovibrio sodomensis]|uniref:hypothetical protein n=1 Tax=Rhodovibrio sodomensis TaxID=1088 RepID=UPI00190320E9|nr:hypothetical protein [Rhodovibrio sodomensis]
MRTLPNNWPSSAHYQGIQFVSQIFDEMFFDYTADSYRTPALSTLHRAYEGHLATQQIIQQALNPVSVKPIVQEMIYSLKNDPISKSILKNRTDFICQRLTKAQEKPKDARDLFAYARDNLDDSYALTAKRLLKEAIHTPHHKEHTQKLCREFGAYLINIGYTRQYIRHIINEILLTGDPNQREPDQLLEEFLSCFTEDVFNFTTYVWVENKFKQYLNQFSSLDFTEIRLADLDNNIKNKSRSFFQNRKGKSLLYAEDIEEKDPAAARNFVSTMLHVNRSFIYSINPESGFSWDERIFVHEPKNNIGSPLGQHQAPLLRRSSVSSKEATARTERRIDTIFKHLNKNSQQQVFRALTSFSNAFNSESLETQFVSVWSSLEVLLPDPSENARIVTYVEYVTACSGIYYSYRNFSWLFSDLKTSYDRAFLELLKEDKNFESDIGKFISIMCTTEHESTRLKLCELVADNPLALWRLHLLHESHKTPASINKFIKRHTERVAWQIHRIYRTRNSLLHSGQRLPYLDSVLMNVQEYFSNIIDALEDRSKIRLSPSHKDTILTEISFDLRFLEERLREGGDSRINQQDILNFVWLPGENF